MESWIAWIIVDLIYVPLYLYKELYLTALLYLIFLAMACMGLKAWRESWLRQLGHLDMPSQPGMELP